ncbi:molybdopterin-dependent oxidoreductase [Epidermidibacterium keratini]|uniref:Molybdopterin-dependent oxidoreductase n=1 Tax=Epidermidibacterium keratini TaxID=1891644 RepID=A0A7L4YHP0_9ACTN|nr:aerobic carbon-monoxide dehydrogenase large subunit [Epidermidibacterium keratini]QHB98985.1 molybdopterin-dependent oxidoreductase [Epidermidibacterium keratini]
MAQRYFGSPIKRSEDLRLTTGNGRYVDDIGARDAVRPYEAAYVRSPHAHAKITGIDIDDALEVEGVIAIYTWEDLEGPAAEPLPVLIPHPSLHAPRTGYPLAKDEVNHVGEAIVMVVATDRYIAEDAANRIVVDYDFLTPVVGVTASRDAAAAVHEDVPDNVAARLVQETGDLQAGFDAASHTLELDLTIERSASIPLEGKGVYARWDSDDASLRVYSSTQTSTSVRAAIAAKLRLPLTKVEVIAPDVGGGFGVKIVHPWPEEITVPMAAIMLNHPVKWTEDRREHFIASSHEREQQHEIKVGFDDDGRITALDVVFWHDNGAYTPYGVICPIVTSTQLLGPYKPGAYRVEFYSIYTNTVIVTPYRGAGRPQGVFAMERTLDAIADYLGKDRVDVRAANFIQPDEFPYDHGLTFQDGRPLIYDSGSYPAQLESLREQIGWDQIDELRADAEARGKWLGAGLACYVEGTGPGPYEGAHVNVLTDGTVEVAIGLTSQGQGHQTAFAQIAADELGVPIERVKVTAGDTRRFGYAVGTFASRAAVMSGSAVALAARAAKAKALRVVSDLLEVEADDLEIVDGMVQVKGDPGSGMSLSNAAVLSNPLRYAFDEAAKEATQFAKPGDPNKPPVPDDSEPGIEGTDYYSPPRSTFASGMHAAIVEIDKQTFDIKIVKYAVNHDCGELINPMIVEGQVQGGLAQGIGGALYEKMEYDDYGQLQNASFMDFLLPYVTEIPMESLGELSLEHQITPSPLNPLGIKGAGEAGVIPVAAVIASAVEDALGFKITEMPLNPSRLFALTAAHAAGDIEDTKVGAARAANPKGRP